MRLRASRSAPVLAIIATLLAASLAGCGSWKPHATTIPEAGVVRFDGPARVTLVDGERFVVEEVSIDDDSLRGTRVDEVEPTKSNGWAGTSRGAYAVSRDHIARIEAGAYDQSNTAFRIALAWVLVIPACLWGVLVVYD